MEQTQTQTLRIERIFDASPEALWDAWTDPEQYAKWFNPFPGQDAEILEWDARPGGKVKFNMVAPDGQKYLNEGAFITLDKPRELVTGEGDMRVRVTFHPEGRRTRLVMEQTGLPMSVPLEQARAGWTAIFDKLQAHAVTLAIRAASPGAGARRITIERTFKAPVAKVWEMWTTPEGVEQWWGPVGFASKALAVEPRAGGRFEIEMKATDPAIVEHLRSIGVDATNVMRATLTEVVPGRRLAARDAVDFIPGVAPYDTTWSVDLHEVPGGTRMVLVMDEMHDAHWTQQATEGWTSQLGRLEGILGAGAASAIASPRGFTIERTFRAAPARVWEMWTTKAGLEQWWVVDGWTSEVTKLDVRVGGQYEIRMTDGTQTIRNHGTYTEVAPVARLAWTWRFDIFLAPGEEPYDVPISVKLEPVAQGTRMTFTQGALASPEFTEGSRQGVMANLEKLAKALGE